MVAARLLGRGRPTSAGPHVGEVIRDRSVAIGELIGRVVLASFWASCQSSVVDVFGVTYLLTREAASLRGNDFRTRWREECGVCGPGHRRSASPVPLTRSRRRAWTVGRWEWGRRRRPGAATVAVVPQPGQRKLRDGDVFFLG